MTEAATGLGLQALLQRRSVSPKRLGLPGPDAAQLQDIVRAGLRAPDHGALAPWRLIEFATHQRPALAELFAQEKQRRDPLVSAQDLQRARAHATAPPVLLAFVVCIRQQVTVPPHEQWLAAGAALGNLLNAIDALGFGGIVLSGERCADVQLLRALGIGLDEKLAGFLSIGSITEAPRPAQPKPVDGCLQHWRQPQSVM